MSSKRPVRSTVTTPWRKRFYWLPQTRWLKRLKREGEKTKVTLSQVNKGKAEVDAKLKAEFKKNWQMMLDGLKKSVEAA